VIRSENPAKTLSFGVAGWPGVANRAISVAAERAWLEGKQDAAEDLRLAIDPRQRPDRHLELAAAQDRVGEKAFLGQEAGRGLLAIRVSSA